MLTCIVATLISALMPIWIPLRLVNRYRDHSAVVLLGFVAQFGLAVATAWLVGVGLDIFGVPMYAPPPKPGNFTLPLPWTFLLPAFQAVTFGPTTALLIGLRAFLLRRRLRAG